MAVGFRVFSGGAKVDIDVVNRLRNLPVANVSDAMNRMSAGGTLIPRPEERALSCARLEGWPQARPCRGVLAHAPRLRPWFETCSLRSHSSP